MFTQAFEHSGRTSAQAFLCVPWPETRYTTILVYIVHAQVCHVLVLMMADQSLSDGQVKKALTVIYNNVI